MKRESTPRIQWTSILVAEIAAAHLKLDKDEVANDIVQHIDALGASMALREDPINQKR